MTEGDERGSVHFMSGSALSVSSLRATRIKVRGHGGQVGLPSVAPDNEVERRMARPGRIELPAPRLGGGCSIR
jgi:hypothetical protein